MRPVLCIRNDMYDPLGITPPVLAGKGLEVSVLDAFDPTARWPAVQDISALIVFGGEMNVDEVARHPYLVTQRLMMLDAIEAGLPVLGICLGAQILARALGARVYRSPVRELGFVPVTITAAGRKDPLLSAFRSGDRVFEWHQDTFDLPQDAVLLASGEGVHAQAFRAGRLAWGVQFHFEVSAEGVEAWLSAAEPSFQKVWKRTADSVRDELRTHLDSQQRRSRELFNAFADHVLAAQLSSR